MGVKMRTEIDVKAINYSVNVKSEEIKKLDRRILHYLFIRRFIELILLKFFSLHLCLYFHIAALPFFLIWVGIFFSDRYELAGTDFLSIFISSRL